MFAQNLKTMLCCIFQDSKCKIGIPICVTVHVICMWVYCSLNTVFQLYFVNEIPPFLFQKPKTLFI